MSRLNERQIILLFHRALGTKGFVSEDVETVRIGKKMAVLKTDTLTYKTDVPPGMKMEDVARKSIVSCVSDFAAKGVRPSHCIISVSLPRSFSRKKIGALASGFSAASSEFGLSIIGGDTNESAELVISVMMFGTADKITRRRGAKAGDCIVATGPFGRTAAGLGIILGKKNATPKFARIAKNAVYHAVPRLGFGISASRYLTSSMDSSDGLSTTLVEMASQSGKKFTITKMPMDPQLQDFSSANRLRLEDLVLNGGEEYEIVATVPRKLLPKVRQIARKNKTPLIEIGLVENGRGVFLLDGAAIRDRGWSHFA